jgi:hypothetical protein
LPELDIGQTHRGSSGTRPAEHFLGHVDANEATVRPDLTRRDKAVETAPEPRSTTRSPGFKVPSENGLPTPAKASTALSGKAATTAWS